MEKKTESLRILAFDPAIKNLAWTIVKKNSEKVIDVIDYGIINLIIQPKCQDCEKESCFLKFNFDLMEFMYCCDYHKEILHRPKKIKKKTTDEINDCLIEKLGGLFNDDAYDLVLIENQPSFLNPQAKSIQMILYTYFKLKNKKVILQNPNAKSYKKKFPKKNKYNETKQFSVDCVKAVIDKKKFVDLTLLGKIDDICDCINHTVAYLYKNDIPNVIKKLIDHSQKL